MNTMQALRWDGEKLAVGVVPVPVRKPGEAQIKILYAGICNTDLEILRGYHAFQGTLGHEFVGIVEECDTPHLLGKKVVSDINCACHSCEVCETGDHHHCPYRVTIGMRGKDGAFAEYINIPEGNLVTISEALPLQQAVFAEPVAAALEIQEQVDCQKAGEVAVIGDGKLGLLISMCLSVTGMQVSLLGHHPEKLSLLNGYDVKFYSTLPARKFPLVVEATGHQSGFATAIQITAARGTLVLKSTIVDDIALNTVPIIVNELTLIGSRCGPMHKAVELIQSGRIEPQRLIEKTSALSDSVGAIRFAGNGGVLKVLLEM